MGHCFGNSRVPAERKGRLGRWKSDRISAAADVPWLTVEKAQLEVAKLIERNNGGDAALVAEIAEHYPHAVSSPRQRKARRGNSEQYGRSSRCGAGRTQRQRALL